jgi:hypothetical protein
MKNLFVFLFILLMPVFASARDSRPEVFGLKLGNSVEQTEKVCRKQGGKWFRSELLLFTCNTAKFHANVEADSKGTVIAVFLSYKDVKFYNEQLKKIIFKYGNNCATVSGANKTLIHECKNSAWVVSFMSYGRNGNYKVYLYSLKEMMNK